MFLIRLNRAQRLAFLNLAHELIKADSVATVGEMTRLAQIRREMDLGSEDSPDELSIEDD